MKQFKKIISLILSLVLLLTVVPNLALVSSVAATQSVIWDGQTATKPAGDGTEASPYLITKPEHLAYAISQDDNAANEYYRLENDIYLNDITKINWVTGIVEEGYTVRQWYAGTGANAATNANDFNGTIDGNGHVIYGLYSTGGVCAGLIPETPLQWTGVKVNVYNLGIENAYISATSYASAFIGRANAWDNTSFSVDIQNCYASASVTIKSDSTAGVMLAFGGSAVNVNACYSLATVEATTAGLIGDNWGAKTVSNVYIRNTKVSGKAGITCSNIYGDDNGNSNGTLVWTSDANMQGLDVLTNNGKMPNLAACDAFMATETYPILKVFYRETSEIKIWDGQTATKPAGEGTEASPYLITKPEHLAYAISNDNIDATEYYRLENDIYLNDITKIDWATGETTDPNYSIRKWYTEDSLNSVDATKKFNGTIDGNGYVVYGLYSAGGNAAGLIPTVPVNFGSNYAYEPVYITNLGIENAYISANTYAAAFIADGRSWGNGDLNITISNCYAASNVTINAGDYAGVMIGCSSATKTVTQCYSFATVTGTTGSGLLGNVWNSSTVLNCYFRNTKVSGNSAITSTNVYGDANTNSNGTVVWTSDANMQGLDVLTNENKMPNLAACDAFMATETYPILKVFYRETSETKIWDGQTATKPVGEGTEASPYLITKPEHLAYAISNDNIDVTEYYRLENDIYLNDITKIDWATGELLDPDYSIRQWYSENNSNSTNATKQFNGTINGNGHIVYGIYTTGGNVAGLIPCTPVNFGSNSIYEPVTITNLGIENAYISANTYASAFIGDGRSWGNGDLNITISNCYVASNVTINSGDYAGVMIGCSSATKTVTQCYSLATISATTDSGLLGYTWNGSTVSNCYFRNTKVSGSQAITCSNVYGDNNGNSNGTVVWTSETNMQGLDVLTNANKMPNLAACDAFVSTKKYPIIKIFYKEPAEESPFWDGYTATKPSGEGTESSPYLITEPEHLAYAIKNGNTSEFYKLANDIYLNDITKIDWTTGEVDADYTVNQWYTNSDVHAFNCSIDGDGYIIYGMYYKNTENADVAVGLIPTLSTGGETINIKNLGIESAYIETAGYASAFVAKANWSNTVFISNSYVGETVTLKGGTASAFYTYGGSTAEINGCYSLAKIEGTIYGLVGDTWGGGVTAKNTYIVNSVITSKTDNSIACENVYANDITGALSGAKALSQENMKGLGALTVNEKMNGLKDCDLFKATISYPILKIFATEDVLVTVEFDACGGTLTETSVSAIAGAIYELPVPTKDGYIFKAWYTDSEYTTVANNIIPESDTVYYAKWYKKYDINNDNDINATDMTSLRKALLYDLFGDSEEFSVDAADCNMDGSINIIDLVRIKKYLVGKANEILPAEYRLVWQEEFSQSDSLQQLKTKELNTTDNAIVDYNNVTVENGNLVMSMNYDSDTSTYYIPPVVSTADTMNFKYGYMEMRAKLPFFGKGEWPALWLLSEDAMLSKDLPDLIQTEYNSEIDIVENLSSTTELQSQLHLWGKEDSVTNILKSYNNSYDFKDSQSANDWNIYSIMWNEDGVKFYVNNVLFSSYTFSSSNKAHFNSYMTPLLSLFYYYPEVESNEIKGTFFEENPEAVLQMEVDYIRLYQNPNSDSLLVK